jgi:hypothetical protein
MSDINKPIAFSELLQKCRQIEVPLIQRDYAQGRDAQKDVRDEFLKALYGALSLPQDDPKLPLNLDFVYGSMEGQDKKNFLPLDGQQRLTTLFLLHWYLAWRDDVLADFSSIVRDGKHARFTYRVRPSSREFFDAIVSYQPAVTAENVGSVRKLIHDQPWFFLHWRLDPTIQSALTMLDAIHERFKNTAGLYARLANRQQPVITFQLLPLEHFGLTDDLYIKMNARGKPLTSFETFKARFEELLKGLFPTEKRKIGGADLSVAEFFERRIDTQWTDFFWRYKNRDTNTFDDALMNLFLVLIRASLNPADPKFTDDTASLRSQFLTATYQTFHDRGWLTRAFAENLIGLLETWSKGGGALAQQLADTRYFNELTFFEFAIKTPASVEYTAVIIFAAFVFYLRQHDGLVQPEPLTEWMRAVFNLAHNTYIERPDEFGRSLAGLQKLLPYSHKILQRLAEMEIEPLGFSQQQLREETLKGKLILSHAGWKSRILAAEQHGYFRGQIGFLLEFAGVSAASEKTRAQDWNETLHTQLQTAFDKYLSRAQLMFNQSGLTPIKAQLWKRALLATGDYVMRYGRNFSFLTDAPTNPDSWKRFLRDEAPERTHLKSLWDQINPTEPVEPQLDQVVTRASGLEPWRAVTVKYPAIIDYCGLQEFRSEHDSDEIYLLKKQQMNGFHAELFSYALQQELESESSLKSLEPLKLHPYQAVTMTEIEPHVWLSFTSSKFRLSFSVFSWKNGFRIQVNKADLATSPTVETALKNDCEFAEIGDAVARATSRDEIHDVLRQIGNRLAGLPPPVP